MKGRKWQMLCTVLGLTAAVMLAAAGCGLGGKKLKKHDIQYLQYFDTLTNVTIYTHTEEEFEEYAALAETELEHYHQLFDIYHDYKNVNNVKTINDRAGVEAVLVDPELLELLDESVEMYEQTDGMVNVAMGSVLSLWHDCREAGKANPDQARLPDTTELLLAAEHVDIKNLVLDKEKSTVYLRDGAMSLDVGAVAKGFTAQRLCDKLREAGVTSALISIGGNVQAIGKRGDGQPWRVGIQNPDLSSQQGYLYATSLEDAALVTSGDYQRYYEVDGVRYHHIIRPGSWMPWNEYASVTIRCADGMQADALSTAVFNMEFEKGLAFIESLNQTEAMWVLPDGTERFSSGFEQYLEK